MLHVTEDLELPDDEIRFVTSRSGGPGGQNVNKVDTRVTVLFDVDGSPSLSAQQRELLRLRLSGRINKEGVLRVTSQRHRTQLANRETALQRFVALVSEALAEIPERKVVAVPAGQKERRLRDKRRRSRVKQQRIVDLDREGEDR